MSDISQINKSKCDEHACYNKYIKIKLKKKSQASHRVHGTHLFNNEEDGVDSVGL